jgi:small subunit ribosomal protein S8
MTDPISDMLIRIKNAFLVHHTEVEIPYSKIKAALAQILVDNNYIESFEVKKQVPRDVIVVKLKYVGKTPAITEVKRLSKPGRRLYTNSKQIPRALGGYGITVVSTSKGIMVDTEARKQNVGGELICQIW